VVVDGIVIGHNLSRKEALRTSCTGQRSYSETDSPIVKLSPSARKLCFTFSLWQEVSMSPISMERNKLLFKIIF
jgi:hypothetical protein